MRTSIYRRSFMKYFSRQIIMQRLQKERDNFQEEMEKLHERLEFQLSQTVKLQRDKENALSELELVKDRWEKTHTSHQKLSVRNKISNVKIKYNIQQNQLLDYNNKVILF